MYGSAGKAVPGMATLPATGMTGMGIIWMIVLSTLLIALGFAVVRFIPRREI
jgi:hypothetical protein